MPGSDAIDLEQSTEMADEIDHASAVAAMTGGDMPTGEMSRPEEGGSAWGPIVTGYERQGGVISSFCPCRGPGWERAANSPKADALPAVSKKEQSNGSLHQQNAESGAVSRPVDDRITSRAAQP
jgi:hypothetical protein